MALVRSLARGALLQSVWHAVEQCPLLSWALSKVADLYTYLGKSGERKHFHVCTQTWISICSRMLKWMQNKALEMRFSTTTAINRNYSRGNTSEEFNSNMTVDKKLKFWNSNIYFFSIRANIKKRIIRTCQIVQLVCSCSNHVLQLSILQFTSSILLSSCFPSHIVHKLAAMSIRNEEVCWENANLQNFIRRRRWHWTK